MHLEGKWHQKPVSSNLKDHKLEQQGIFYFSNYIFSFLFILVLKML